MLTHCIRKTYYCFWSIGPDRRTGGVLTIVSRQLMSLVTSQVFDNLEDGRLARLKLIFQAAGSTGALVIWNFHNICLQPPNVQCILGKSAEDRALSMAAPLQYLVVLVGDFNTPGDLELRTDGLHDFGKAPPTLYGLRKQLHDSLRRFVEMKLGGPTHCSLNHLCQNCVEEICWSLPPWATMQCRVSAKVLDDPLRFFLAGVSDHAPISACICRQVQSAATDRPPPAFVCKHPVSRRPPLVA